MSRGATQSLRIGCVKYLNARPLVFGLPGEVLLDHPAALCGKLAAGELDIALVSSIEYLRNPVYEIVDGVCIAADGPVYSVFVAHREPIDQLDEIIVDEASQTSAILLRCLLGEQGLRPRLSARAESQSASPGGRCGGMMIGDQGIEFRRRHPDFGYWDLGSAWQDATGLPFVFALWLIRSDVPNAREVAAQLRRQCEMNLQSLDTLISAESRYPAEFCEYYLRDCLRFRLGEQEKAGLLRFRALCEKHEVLPPDATPLRLV